ncbi:tat pathway signal sequence [Colletotrichum lupini]|uniref:Tat pathway signal sequence n=1 Tax=Colletotrichum lupini TaxID=145971 RepID=A0A9Q8WFS3_9PEZI|nr:tat pathway signal sequence [Colletotrichum lupini]UQC81636.1 tat pathway signal sequence [Colletotrichum lupini]
MMQEKEDESSSRLLAGRVQESEEDLESLQSVPDARQHDTQRRRDWRRTAAVVLVFALSNLFSMHLGAHMRSTTADLDGACAAHTTQWSPVLKDVDVEYNWKHFNGSFLQEDIFRKEASPEVDAAWESMGVDYRAGVISIEDGLKSGLDMSFVRRSEKHGAGFFVNVEGMHHLHCLNLVRKSLYYNYDYYKKMGTHAFANEEHIVRLHVSHCLDTIRQVLVCNVDTGVLGQVWAGDPPAPFPDFNTKHMCKNYEAIQEWAEKLQAPPVDTLPGDYTAPPEPSDVLPTTP